MGKIIAYLLVVTVIGLLVGGFTYGDESRPRNSSSNAGEVLLRNALDVHTDELKIQFIGNAAFHITDGESTLLTDFPYKSGAYGYMQYRMEDVKPIKDGLCLITHPHLDHWDQELFEETDHAIIAPPDILENIKSDKKIPFDDVMTYKDIVVKAFETRHGGPPRHFKHYSYLVTWHGLRLYIPGDTVVDHALTMKDIDIMFIPVWFTNKIRSQDLAIDAKTRVVFHQQQGQEIPPSQDYVVLKQGETLIVKFKQKVCPDKPTSAEIARRAAAEGKLAYKLTTPEELKALLGKPQRENEKDEGDVMWLDMGYPDIDAWFVKRDGDTSFKLLSLSVADEELDIGGMLQGQRQVIVRNIDDFHEIGLRNVNLKNLDLSGERDYLKCEDFDSLTQWPDAEKLPAGFDPNKMLEEGKNPGLGIRSLHERGINGKGVGIAILDQPLLLGHEEYSSRILRYDATKASWLSPQMHGSPIMGIAVGKTCGVAPGAFVFYYAACTTLEHRIQADWINEIIRYNETNPQAGRIRVISISASPEEASDNDAFLKDRKKALDSGIIVVTCSDKFLDYGNLILIEGKDPDKPENYRVGRYGGPGCKLNIPTGNKTIATHQGTNVYKYEREGGMSWAAPYLAGLAALAYQVDPKIEPKRIVELWVETAVQTEAGPVVNPAGFIEAVRELK